MQAMLDEAIMAGAAKKKSENQVKKVVENRKSDFDIYVEQKDRNEILLDKFKMKIKSLQKNTAQVSNQPLRSISRSGSEIDAIADMVPGFNEYIQQSNIQGISSGQVIQPKDSYAMASSYTDNRKPAGLHQFSGAYMDRISEEPYMYNEQNCEPTEPQQAPTEQVINLSDVLKFMDCEDGGKDDISMADVS